MLTAGFQSLCNTAQLCTTTSATKTPLNPWTPPLFVEDSPEKSKLLLWMEEVAPPRSLSQHKPVG